MRALNDTASSGVRSKQEARESLQGYLERQPSSRGSRSRFRSRAAIMSRTATIAAHKLKPATPIMKNVASFIGQDHLAPLMNVEQFFSFQILDRFI
jgi:hypothetical protein